jgi:23S rRNA pseudouridine955/2504/2580 synthase
MEFSPNQEKENAKHCAMEIQSIVGDQIKEISQENNHLLLEITLHTGRKHQIRSVLSYFGLPVIGDKKYNSKTIIKDKINLFAYKIIFDNLPSPLSYLNGKEFQMERLKLGKLS